MHDSLGVRTGPAFLVRRDSNSACWRKWGPSDTSLKTDCVSLLFVLKEEPFDLTPKITAENVMIMFEFKT